MSRLRTGGLCTFIFVTFRFLRSRLISRGFCETSLPELLEESRLASGLLLIDWFTDWSETFSLVLSSI